MLGYPPIMPSTPNERIEAARERAGLELQDVADRLGITFEHARDLEWFEDEATMTLSLRELRHLGDLIGLTPLQILEGEDQASGPPIPFAEFSKAIAAAAAQGGGIEAWGHEVGWDVAPLIDNPENIGDLNADGLRDIAKGLGLDWRRVLP